MAEWDEPSKAGQTTEAETQVLSSPQPSFPEPTQDPFVPFQEQNGDKEAEEGPVAVLRMPKVHFGQLLQQLRLNRNCSISQAAAQSHISPNTIVTLEAGEIGKLDMGMYYIASCIERLCHVYGNAPATPVTDAFMRDYAQYSQSHGLIRQKKPFFDADQEDRRLTLRLPALLIGFVAFLLLALVLGAFVVLLLRISNDARRIKAFYAAEDAARAKDMAMATNIQVNSIPRAFPPFVNERRMDIFATMHTARDVGGDFYDFFFTAPSKVAFLVADVSGKGVPAALFMMRAKATIKGETRSGLPLNEVMAHVNDALSRDNDANMFVTAWMGVIDLETGEVTFVNAGHNPPILIEGAGDDERKFLRERSGMVLGAMPGLKYRMHTVRLSPGAMIYLYTDGITEQPDGKGELFGEDRLLFSVETMLSAGVGAIDGAKSPLLAAIFDAVITHGSDVEQADDCTQLVIRYNGAGEKRRFTVAQSGIAEASTWLDEWLDKAGVVSLSATLHVILDEICSNIVKHSDASFFELGLSRLVGSSGVRMEFVDDGVPYDPLTHVDPDTTAPVEGRPIGGLGILMVKRMASSITYQRVADRNCLVIERTCKTQGDCSGSKG